MVPDGRRYLQDAGRVTHVHKAQAAQIALAMDPAANCVRVAHVALGNLASYHSIL